MSKKKKRKGQPPSKVVKETPRFLGPLGYVSDPKYGLAVDASRATDLATVTPDFPDELQHPPEPEPVDRETQKWITKEAKELHSLRTDFEHDRRLAEKQSLERRLTDLLAIAKERGVDVHADVQFIRRRLDRIEDRLKAA